MRPRTARDSKPRRRRSKTSIITLLALFTLAGAVQVLTPASASAMVNSSDAGCKPKPDGNLPPGIGEDKFGNKCSLEFGGDAYEVHSSAPPPRPKNFNPCELVIFCLPGHRGDRPRPGKESGRSGGQGGWPTGGPTVVQKPPKPQGVKVSDIPTDPKKYREALERCHKMEASWEKYLANNGRIDRIENPERFRVMRNDFVFKWEFKNCDGFFVS